MKHKYHIGSGKYFEEFKRMSHRRKKTHRKNRGKRGRKKVKRVMHEFKKGALYSSSGRKVTKRKQAIAIALSEAGLSRKGRKRKK